ncbi:lectin-like domain-containing protein [Chitinophaga sp. NPDC101104]|uniref:lectin-like domain-containing protein n=1 Tax=Chitinophaga sp. NPDC101104 TaxID=3390561 RepID=UPI003D01E93C
MKRANSLISCLLFSWITASAQSAQQPYILNGSATQQSCNCYVLTPDQLQSSGSVWNKNKISLLQSFDYTFEIYLGCKDQAGADGMGFVLQTKGTNLGGNGQGLGFKGISPSVGILVDTWHNADENDPAFDHLSIQINGVSNHAAPENIAGPTQLLAGKDNIEDCQWHLFRIRWNATAHQLDVWVDGQLRQSVVKDLVGEVFGNDPMVFWGFAAATAGASNLQQFCAALRPKFQFNGGQIFCDGTPVTFLDNSSSFGTITRWYWDLGDGTKLGDPLPKPHLYPEAGKYEVKMVIEDNSGCISDTLKNTVTIGSYPEADFGHDTLCTGAPLQLNDASTVEVGTLGKWRWDFGGGKTSTAQHPVAPYTAPGTYSVTLETTSEEGCGDIVTKDITVYPTPEISATAAHACIGEPTVLRAANRTPAITIADWYWQIGGKETIHRQNTGYRFPERGSYAVTAYAISGDGCAAKPIALEAKVTDIGLEAGRDTVVSRGQPLQLHAVATGSNLQYRWWPSTGLSDPSSPETIAVPERDQSYRLTVRSPEGCVQEDELMVKVYTGPEFYVPTGFTPNNDGVNDRFRVIAPGVTQLSFFRVWDRWGKIVWESKSLSDHWNGEVNGNPAPAGTYVWMVEGTDYTARKFSRRGTVTLIR